MILGEDTAPLGAGIDNGATANDGTGGEHTIASDLGVVADDGTELAQSGGKGPAIGAEDGDLGVVEFDIRENDAGSEVGLVAEDGISDVIVMGHLGLVENEAVFELAGVSGDDAVADDDILTNVTPAANLTALADPGGALDHGALLDDGTGPDKDGIADEGFAYEAGMNGGFQTELEIGGNLGKGLPDILEILENDAVLRTAKIKETLRLKHGMRIARVRGDV